MDNSKDMSERPERLSDEELAPWRVAFDASAVYSFRTASGNPSPTDIVTDLLATPEMQRLIQLHALVYGGTCPDCGGRGSVVRWGWHDGQRDADHPCPNPSCVSGRTPTLRERLEAARYADGEAAVLRQLDAILADFPETAP